jgi:hypothetical protein
MASNFEKELIFLLKRRWDDSTKLPEKYKFQGRNAKAEVCINSGTLGMVRKPSPSSIKRVPV